MADWRAIPGFSFYEASEGGAIRSIPRKVACKGGKRWVPGVVLKPWKVSRTGYLQVMLSDRKAYSVHRLVAFAFHGKPEPGAVVNHLNGVKDDNRPENLEWTTHGGNMRHAFRVLGARRSTLGKTGKDHPASKGVISTDMKTGQTQAYPSAMDAVRDGFDSGCISRCCSGKSSSHKGRTWRLSVGSSSDHRL
jgi:hypothetical protein